MAPIRRRQDAVAYLFENAGLREDVRSELARIADLERLAGRVSLEVATPRDLGMLRDSLHRLPTLAALLVSDASSLEVPPLLDLQRERALLDELATLARELEVALVDSPAARASDGDFIREHGVRAAAARDLCASCHSETYCASCHGKSVPALASTLAFDDPLRAGFHRAGFRARHSEEARGQPGLCSTCHGADYCQSCHDDEGIGAPRAVPGSVHESGWVGVRGTANRHGPAARANPSECAGCHSGAGEALCIGCHRVGGNGGNPHPAGWSSRLSKTNDLPCRLCHSFGF